ncbi:DUF4844 domain-containing protein [Chryseobacterium turcicum]|uniref:DUF4844 domain-containing protein n=1 Tax=Chryseobacterium turcicum TaxID=2898076 RepID=A0A9Q3V4G1_9FLAO|nr:DUF4844 domain-containing protein [Chryseobacterium turcicum]MCD1117081.1 DUF4844 domain-containing protein [Chryseobacterium turcicum]
MSSNKIEILNNLKNTRKFGDKDWIKRGLNPSNQEVCELLENNIDNCLVELIQKLEIKYSDKDILKILKTNLKKLGKNFDTEEREFVADYYDQISKILSIDFSSELNSWLYGSLFSSLQRVNDFFRGKEKILNIIQTKCTKCNSNLDTFILEKMDNDIQNDYNIVKCINCSEYNLIDNESGNKRIKFGNYELIEQLPKNNFNLEDAEIRLKQIKIFRN